MPPAPERHRQGDRRQAEHGDPPAGSRHLDPVGHIGQPRRPHPRQPAKHPGAEPVIEPEPRRVLGDQERAGQDHGPKDEPRRRADGERVRQRRGRARRAALAVGAVDSRAGRQAVRPVPRDHGLGFSLNDHPLPAEQPLCAEPALGYLAGVLPVYFHPRIQRAQRGRAEAGRHGVERGHQARAVTRHDIPAHQRRDVLGRLQAAIVSQHHQVPRGDARIRAEQQGYVYVALGQGLKRQRPPGVKRDE